MPAQRLPFAIVALLAFLQASGAAAEWSPEPLTVRPLTSPIRPIEACSDGGGGAFVAWQEESSYGVGVLRVQHVVASGALHPAWPEEGVTVCAAAAARTILTLIADDLGGVHVIWLEGSSVKAARVTSTGTLADGWSPCGTDLATSPFASAISDGANGFYLTWIGSRAGPDPYVPKILRMGPDGEQAGWSGGPRDVHAGDPEVSYDLWPRLAPAIGGGVYVAWVSWHADTNSTAGVRLMRIGAEGEPALGWPPTAVPLGVFNWSLMMREAPAAPPRLIDVASDGRGGAFVVSGRPVEADPYYYYPGLFADVRLQRIAFTGAPAAGWPGDGMVVTGDQTWPYGHADEAFEVRADGQQGAFVGLASYASEGSYYTNYSRWTDKGFAGWVGSADRMFGKSVAATTAASLFIATFEPNGPCQPWTPYANLKIIHRPPSQGWSDFSEVHFEVCLDFYGDIAVVPAGSDAALFFWSQHRERYGLFVQRLGAPLPVDVPGMPPGALSLRAWFVSGAGIRALAAGGSEGAARLDVFDLTGRRVAGMRVADARAFEAVIPGTKELGAGIYFLRLDGIEFARARVAVVR